MPSLWNPEDSITEVRPGVFFVQDESANWVFITEHGRVTLIDTGYPASRDRLRTSLRFAGYGFDDIVALLITHAHTDHIGSAAFLTEHYNVPVMASPEEIPHLCRDVLYQVGVKDVLPHVWRPRMISWAVHAVRAGAFDPVSVERKNIQPLKLGQPVDVPGHPIPLLIPGHTPGNTVFYLAERKIMIVGDSFVTGHPLSTTTGPQMLHSVFQHDTALARKSLALLRGYEADVYLPGHGPAGYGSFPAAVECAGSGHS